MRLRRRRLRVRLLWKADELAAICIYDGDRGRLLAALSLAGENVAYAVDDEVFVEHGGEAAHHPDFPVYYARV